MPAILWLTGVSEELAKQKGKKVLFVMIKIGL